MKEENKLPHLSKVIDISQFKKGQANIIVAPCHSGKTTAAKDNISKLASSSARVVYLIDTAAGKSALASEKEFTLPSHLWINNINISDDYIWGIPFYGYGFRVMTYHQFGYILQEEPNLLDYIDVLICDEMHNLVRWWNIERANAKNKPDMFRPCEEAIKEIVRASKRKNNTPFVIIMTATPNEVSYLLANRNVPVEYFDYQNKVYSDKTLKTIYYSDIEKVLKELKDDEKALIYVQSVSKMENYKKLLENGKRKICCLWSIHYEKELNEFQKEVRNSIMMEKRVPDDIDILIINSAYETSLNIKNEDFNTVIIHSNDPDTRIQVRGRIRHDIEKLYCYDKNHQHISQYFPEEYYDIPLTSKERNEIVEIMNLKDEKGRQQKWPSIREELVKDGIIINDLRNSKMRYNVVHKAV